MLNYRYYVVILILVILHNTNGLEFNKQQRYNPSVDFLAHEAGPAQSVWPQRDNPVPMNNDYNAQFPSLGSPPSNPKDTKLANTSFGKRDYVAPILPTQKTQYNGKRDYVAPEMPTSKAQQSPNNDNVAQTPTQKPMPSGKRDYVAPQFTTERQTTNQNTGKVKDLINFYDNKPKEQSGSQKGSSYSSILQGNNHSGTTALSNSPATLKPMSLVPKKPLSFSAIVGGANKPVTTPGTPKPSPQNILNNTPFTTAGNLTPTQRPGNTILPSSLLNTNKNNNQGNNNGPTDADIQILSEELLRKDSNNAAKYITVNYQQKTTSQSKEDKAQQPFLTVTSEAWNIPTIQKLIPLLDNYERDTLINEYVTPQERNEENAFMDVIMNTAVIRHLMNFLKDRGYVTPDPKQQRDYLKQLWFNLYSRGRGKISSSGFEHVFVSELKNGDVQGLHNWIYFSREEAANRLNYLGYLKYQQFEDKGAVAKIHFNQQGADKPVDTMFIGTSPELEIALYTLCFVTRADNDCQLKLATKDVNIITHTFRYRSKNYIGSAYPQI